MRARTPYWASVAVVVVCGLSSRAKADPPWQTRDQIICRANSAVGYSYYWGGSCWCANGCNDGGCSHGSCSGNCPNCTHSGSYGADCSGLVNKVWQVPNAIATTTCGHGPYTASRFTSNGPYWNTISRSNIQAGDTMASSTHVVIYHRGDAWGQPTVYEARGCSWGIVHNARSFSSSYTAARRINITSCQCTAGETQQQACGNCGTRKRTCGSNCQWGGWSGCQGEGACAPGQSQHRACGNCGTDTRTCGSNCQWGGWSGCGSEGPCAPGQTEEASCGNCGRHTHTCESNCRWGAFSACEGEGECPAGGQETRECGDCGTQTRTCSAQCGWQDWGQCAGPDPAEGTISCDTQQPGPCAEGRLRCEQGWTKCVPEYVPTAEVCDGVDNDCSGQADDNGAQTMGATPPPYAAQLDDLSYPTQLAAGQVGKAWATFVNRGAQGWKKGQLWLVSRAEGDKKASLLREESWPAWNVAAVLEQDVEPGARGRFAWTIKAPQQDGQSVVERFEVVVAPDQPVRCPASDFEMRVQVGQADRMESKSQQAAMAPATEESCGCRVPSQGKSSRQWMAMVALGLAGWACRRSRRRTN